MPKIYEALCEKPRSVILDTDIGPDCDDAGAIAVLCGYSRKLGFDISAVINCTSNPYGDGAVDALVRLFGLPGVPQGRFCRRSFLEEHCRYNKPVALDYSKAYAGGELTVGDSLEVYRKSLEAAPKKGVTVVTIGQFNALAEIFEAEPELCAEKIYAIVSMAGSTDENVAEYNVVCDVPAAKSVFSAAQKLEIPLILLPFETGVDVMTGFSADEAGRDALRDSYRYFTDGAMRRNSWDLTAVHFAAEGEGELYSLSAPMTADVLPGGQLKFCESEKGCVFAADKKLSAEALASVLDGLMAKACVNINNY